jgi:thiol-disulfide isomerase/thioredoxin
MSRRRLVPGIAVTLVALVALVLLRRSGSPARSTESDTAALTDLTTGKTVGLEQARSGKATLLWFFQPGCGPCEGEAPAIAALAEKHQQRATFLGITSGDLRDQIAPCADAYQLDMVRFLIDDTGATLRGYNVVRPPLTILLDAGGEVVKTWQGPVDASAIDEALREETR